MLLRGLLPLLVALALGLPSLTARAQAPGASEVFVVVLATAATPTDNLAKPLPAAYRGNQLYWRLLMSGNSTTYQLCLGFFGQRSEAERARRELTKSFAGARVIPVSARERDNVLRAQQKRAAAPSAPAAAAPIPAPAAAPPLPGAPAAPALAATPPEAAPAAAPAAPAPSGKADALMAEGRAAIGREDYAGAVRAFTQLIALPENAASRDAQEFLALAYERRGDAARARIEYENYLRRYPEGEDSARVRQRLANLRSAPQSEPLRAPVQATTGWRSLVVGSLSQFYYRGNSKIDTKQAVANTLDQQTLSLTDQSALITNLDVSARVLDNTHDNRVVIRDTSTLNYLDRSRDINRLNAAYYDYRYKPADFSARLGRQPGNSGGLLGIFDGALLGYGLTPGLRVNMVGGEPVDPGFSIDSQRRFLGVGADIGPFKERWTGSAYFLRQDVDGIADRQVAGLEMRYFAPQGALVSTLDYDTVFHHVNIGTLQGNWVAPSNTAVNFLLDYRMTPALQTTTALIGEATTSIQTLLQTYSEEELRQRARALTAWSTVASAGVIHPVSRAWQLGASLSVSRISQTEGTNNYPATPDTGNVRTLTGQAIGTGLFATRDVNVISVSGVNSPDYHGIAGRVASRAPLDERWTLEASLFWYQQSNDNGSDLQRISPDLRLGYRWGRRITLEVEAGIENSQTRSSTLDEKTRRNYFSLGYRWDF
jgi:tetratricopeptide (TPR) repeat protein